MQKYLGAFVVVSLCVAPTLARASDAYLPQIKGPGTASIQSAMTNLNGLISQANTAISNSRQLLAAPIVAFAHLPASSGQSTNAASNLAAVIQTGKNNTAMVSQAGYSNISLVMQQGSGNVAIVSQTHR